MPSPVARLLRDLARVRSLDVALDETTRAEHAGDESGLAPIVPAAVVRPSSIRELAEVLALATKHSVSVTPRGGATGKAGGAIPDADGIALVLSGLPSELDVDVADRVAIASASTITLALHEAAASASLFYGPDPSSLASSTLGGNVATNASGPSSLRYGDTRRWTLGLEAVTGDGRILSMPRRTSKASSGYDLVALLAGSEGTLAVVTRVWMRLAPRPERVVTASILLRSLESIGPVLVALDRAGLDPRAIELLDDATLDVLRAEGRGDRYPASVRAVLLVELDGDEHAVVARLERLADVTLPLAEDVWVARDEREREALWAVRRDMSYALRRSARYKLSDDVVVPRSRVADLVVACRRIAAQTGIRMPTYGHAGDGNLHVNFLWDDPALTPHVDDAMRALFVAVSELSGTLSGEHGLGRAKARFVPLVHDPIRIAQSRALRAVFDPAGVLNRGKVLPPE